MTSNSGIILTLILLSVAIAGTAHARSIARTYSPYIYWEKEFEGWKVTKNDDYSYENGHCFAEKNIDGNDFFLTTGENHNLAIDITSGSKEYDAREAKAKADEAAQEKAHAEQGAKMAARAKALAEVEDIIEAASNAEAEAKNKDEAEAAAKAIAAAEAKLDAFHAAEEAEDAADTLAEEKALAKAIAEEEKAFLSYYERPNVTFNGIPQPEPNMTGLVLTSNRKLIHETVSFYVDKETVEKSANSATIKYTVDAFKMAPKTFTIANIHGIYGELKKCFDEPLSKEQKRAAEAYNKKMEREAAE